MKGTRHNGRSGKDGVYNPLHNDRRFDPEHSEHIDNERVRQNIYWDCYQGYTTMADRGKEDNFSFNQIEMAYYVDHYSDYVINQNKRHEKARHPDRCKGVEDVLKNKKTCPEESIRMKQKEEIAVQQEMLNQQRDSHVCSVQIWKEAFDHFDREPKKFETNEICSIMDTQIAGWKRAGVHRFSKEGYGRQRSWIREGAEEEGGNEPDKDGFTKLTKAEQLELPFDLPDREKG